MIKISFDTKDIKRLQDDLRKFEDSIRKELVWTSADLSKQMRQHIQSTVYDSYAPKLYKRSFAIKHAVRAGTERRTYYILRTVFIDDNILKANNPIQPVLSKFHKADWANPKHKSYAFFVHEGRGYENVPPPPYNIRNFWRTPQPLAKTRRPFVESLYKALINGDALLRRFLEIFKKSFRG